MHCINIGLVTSLCLLELLAIIVLSNAVNYDGKIRDVGGGRMDAYMIPPDRSNHASFLEIMPQSGVLVMAWFSGTSEGEDKCSIVVAHLPANSSQWSNATLVSRRDGYSNQNPVLYYDNTTSPHRLNLFHSQQKATLTGGGGGGGIKEEINVSNREDNSHIWMCESVDQSGLKWSEPTEIFTKDGSFDRNRIVPSATGGLIYPIYYSVDGNENQYSAMKLSSDHINWKGYPVTHSNYLVQPTVVRPVPNKQNILAFFRDRRAEHIYSASSNDEGYSWTTPEKTVLPNNNAAIQAAMLSSGNMAIVFNPTTKERNQIRIAISKDGGQTWPVYRDLEYTPSGEHERAVKSVEYSYPSLLQTADGYIHVSYTYNRDTIKYVKFMESWVIQKNETE